MDAGGDKLIERAETVDGAIRRSIAARGRPRDAKALSRLREDVSRAVPDADVGFALTVRADLLVYLDGHDLRELLPKADLPEPGTPEYRRAITRARNEVRGRMQLRELARLAGRPRCKRRRSRESRPRVRRMRRAGRSPRATRAGPHAEGDPEPGEDRSHLVGLAIAGRWSS